MEPSVGWDAPWSTNLIRNHSPWTLAGDAGMFLYLQQSGTDFASKALEAQTAVEDIYVRSNLLNKKLDNAFNDFQMLSNTQFLENRIEEELTEASQANKNPENTNDKLLTKEEKEEQLKLTFKECLKKSFEIFANARLGTDSEADLLFTERPSLPHIIGSEEYNSSETVGIVFPFPAIPVENPLPNGIHENGPPEQLRGDITDDEDLFPDAAAASHSNTASEMADGDSSRGMDSSGMLPDEDNQEDGSFDADSSHEQERASTDTIARPTGLRDNADRNEQRTIVLSPPNLDETDTEDEDDLFVVKPKRTLTVSNKGYDATPNAQNSEVSNPNQQGSLDVGLSRDEVTSSMLEQPPPLQNNANIDSDSSSSEDDLFKSVRKVTVGRTEPSKSVVNVPQKSGTVSGAPGRVKFSEDDESDNEDVPPLHPKPTSNLMAMFDESSDDDTFLISTRSSTKPSLFAPEDSPVKKPAVSSSADKVLPNQVESSSSGVAGNVDKQSEDEEPDSKPLNVTPNVAAVSTVTQESDSDDGFPNMTGKPSNLARIFGSTDDDDFHPITSPDSKMSEKEKTVPAPSEQASVAKEEKVLKEQVTAKQPSGFLDNDDDDDGDLFHNVSKKNSTQQKPEPMKPENHDKPKQEITDDSDDELFKSVTLPPPKVTAFNDGKRDVKEIPKITADSDSDDLFTSSIEKKASAEKKPVEEAKSTASTSKDVKEEFIDPLGTKTISSVANTSVMSPSPSANKFIDVTNTVELPPLDVGNEPPVLSSPKKIKSPQVSESIAKRQMNIKIPIPGMAPPPIRKIQPQTSVPAATSTGASVTEIGKDKSKLGPKRRPPSRPSKTSPVVGSLNVSRDPSVPQLPKLAEVVQMPQPDPVKIPEASPVQMPAPSGMIPPSTSDFDIFEESLSAPVTFNKKTSDNSPLGTEAKKEIVDGSAQSPQVDIFAENMPESSEKAKIATNMSGATKKKKAGNAKSAKSKSKKSGAAGKGDTSKKPDLFDTPDDIFDD